MQLQIGECKKTLRKAKREGWRDYCTSLNSLTPTGDIWKVIKRYRNRKLTAANATPCWDDKLMESIDQTIRNICPPSCSSPALSMPDSTSELD